MGGSKTMKKLMFLLVFLLGCGGPSGKYFEDKFAGMKMRVMSVQSGHSSRFVYAEDITTKKRLSVDFTRETIPEVGEIWTIGSTNSGCPMLKERVK
jgi:hypothetical protein